MSQQFTDIELKQLADRWVAQWNEPDPGERRRMIRELWAEDGYQILVNPPEAVRAAAAHLSVPFPSLEIRGHDALFERVGRAYDMFVGAGDHVFEQQGEPIRHAGAAVAVTWVMRSRADESVAGSGLEVLTFGPDGRVHSDHEYVA
ncbi:hypothetical protein [Nocardia sp. alder85J]|uniref:hypothetical protein n=1 Tax=Nocardia sp. alder85J TaxID=2862949 RepID=UPI001CD5566D|nr:hypothetical protein [Nocardia sp. alder85J]MCX4092036.1 hypothetical protein [Nocardia sp. alder85J]